MATVIENTLDQEVEVVARVLKEFGEPIKLKDLVELTKDYISWNKNPSGQMNLYMRYNNHIVRAEGFGRYEYVERPIVEGNEAPVEEVKPKQEAKPNNIAKDNKEEKKMLSEQKLSEEVQEMHSGILNGVATTKRRYKAGDTLEGRVSGIETYGVFIENDHVEGLVHHTNIKYGATSNLDLHRHFKVGDTIRAKVLLVKPDGKLSLTTRGMELPDYSVQKEEVETETKTKENVIKVDEDKMENVYTFIQSITGVVSDEAKAQAKLYVEQHGEEGLFKFMLAMAQVAREFNPDMSLVMVKEIGEKMSEGL